MKAYIFSTLFALLTIINIPHAEAAEQIVLDAVVASIDGKPITLSDVSKKIKKPLTLKECATDPLARSTVDSMIQERLIQAEADAKHISVSTDDIESYINEVSQRNNLSREQFQEALSQQGKDLAAYKEEIKSQILKARLISSYLQANSGISDEEISQYLSKHAARNKKNGARVTLSQIVLFKEKHSEEQAKKTLAKVLDLIKDGDSFEDLAARYSEGSEAEKSGLIGTMSVNELSSEVFNAVLSLKEGQVSEITETPAGYHLFYVDKKDEEEEDKDEDQTYSEEEKSSARQILEQNKVASKTEQYFAEELYKLHAVDKKI
jgi:peptidyl-prolyl cis-trans isomerase SurA